MNTLVRIDVELSEGGELDGGGHAEAVAAASDGRRRQNAPLHIEALLLEDANQVDAGLLEQRMAAPLHDLHPNQSKKMSTAKQHPNHSKRMSTVQQPFRIVLPATASLLLG